MKRIEFLDGLRGIAILLVVLYHAFARWPAYVPYGKTYLEPFNFGPAGVYLFFLISGFVILMSLENGKSFSSFIWKRWLRLFPAMFVATILIYSTAHFFYERPRGVPPLSSVVPGLLFIEPNWLSVFTDFHFRSLEGAFWSLYVEVKFYILFGLMYFFLGKNKAILGLCILFLLSFLPLVLHSPTLKNIVATSSIQHFAWFAGGAFAYLYFIKRENKFLLACIAICSCAAVRDLSFSSYIGIASFGVLVLFLLPIYFSKLQPFLSTKFLLFFGLISYPLYLIHENAMIALIIKLDYATNHNTPDIVLVLMPVCFLCAIAYLIAKYIEPFLKNTLARIKPL